MQTHPESLSDEDIVLRIRAGEIFLYAHIMDRYADKLVRYGRRFLREPDILNDAVQDIFTKAYEHLASFDASRRFQPWIYRIAHNVFVNTLRTQRTSWVILEWDTLFSLPSRDTSEEDERSRAELRTEIDRGIAKLSAPYREILTLHYFEELPYADIADVLQIPIGTVSARIKRAKDALRNHMNDYDNRE